MSSATDNVSQDTENRTGILLCENVNVVTVVTSDQRYNKLFVCGIDVFLDIGV